MAMQRFYYMMIAMLIVPALAAAQQTAAGKPLCRFSFRKYSPWVSPACIAGPLKNSFRIADKPEANPSMPR